MADWGYGRPASELAFLTISSTRRRLSAIVCPAYRCGESNVGERKLSNENPFLMLRIYINEFPLAPLANFDRSLNHIYP